MPKAKGKTQVSKVKGFVYGKRYVESIILDGEPAFIVKDLKTGKISFEKSFELDDYIIRPLWKSECGYFPYSFKRPELTKLLLSSEISTDEVLHLVKRQIDRYIDAPELVKTLILGDILITYSLEWISTLHYPFFVGETESGKSSVLHLGRWLNYRCLFSESIPHADIYNFLGEKEEGTGTICEDEAQNLVLDKEKILTYKSSYSKGSVKPRVVTLHSKKYQVFYRTFCPKWFAGEKLPRNKGFVERLAIVHMTGGKPKGNIKRLTPSEMSQLSHLRNKLLLWKIQRVCKKQTTFKSNLTGRDQELWEDFLSIFEKTKFWDQAEKVVKHYTNQRKESIRDSFEAAIFKILIENLDAEKGIEAKVFWDVLTNQNTNLPGKFDSWNERTFIPNEFDVNITPNSLANLVEDKFQGNKVVRTVVVEGKSCRITTYYFDEKVVKTLKSKYGI